MVRKERSHLIAGGDSRSSGLKPAHLTKQEFATRLNRLMMAKGWHQAELARQSDLTRDSISGYIGAKRLPTVHSLNRLAEVFGITPEELLPNIVETAIDEDVPSFEFKVSTANPKVGWLRLNRAVTFTAQLKIAEILNADTPFNGD